MLAKCPGILRSLEALYFQRLVQILLFEVQSVHRLAGPFFLVAFCNLSNSFLKADHASVYLAVFLFFLCLLKDAFLCFPCLLLFNLRSLKLFNYSTLVILAAESSNIS